MKNRAQDDGCCGANFLKYILFIFNFLFYLSAIVVFGLGVWTYVVESHYFVLLPSSTAIYLTYGLIVLGLLALLFGILGCLAVLRMNKCALLAFSVSLLVLLLVEAVCACVCFVYARNIHNDVNQSIDSIITHKYTIDQHITTAVDKLQLEHYCCGGSNYTMWRTSEWHRSVNTPKAVAERGGSSKVPSECCRTSTRLHKDSPCTLVDHPSNIYPDGCALPLAFAVAHHLLIVSAIVMGVAAIHLFGLIISCCLYSKLDDDQETQQQRRFL